MCLRVSLPQSPVRHSHCSAISRIEVWFQEETGRVIPHERIHEAHKASVWRSRVRQ
jgi:hypothetical protein